jgi:hypothetical protein
MASKGVTPRLCFCSRRLTELTYNVVYPRCSVFSLTACSSCQVLFCDSCSVPNNTTLPISKTDLRGPPGGSHCQVRRRSEAVQKTTIRGTTVYCDFKATTGSEVYDAAWMTSGICQSALLAHTKLIVATPGRYSLPGWESVQKTPDFFKAAARLGDASRPAALAPSVGRREGVSPFFMLFSRKLSTNLNFSFGRI